MKMKREELMEYLESNFNVLESLVAELNSWNNCLEHLEFWENEESTLQEFFGSDLINFIQKIKYGDYNVSDDYFRFNGYGNLDSYSYKEMKEEIIDEIEEIINCLEEYYYNIYIDDSTVQEYVDSLESEEEEE